MRTSRRSRYYLIFAALLVALLGAMPLSTAGAGGEATRYLVVLSGTATDSGFALSGTRDAALALVASSGGTVVSDLSRQTGVLIVDSPNPLFDEVVRSSPLVSEAGEDYRWKAYASNAELASATAAGPPDGKCPSPPDPTDADCQQPPAVQDPFEAAQWDMQQICVIRTTEYQYCGTGAHSVQKGKADVEVGILDSGFDGRHPDLSPNADCARGRNSVNAMVGLPGEEQPGYGTPGNPGVGTPDPCTDNQFHGTHVAGTVAADDNGVGMVGVAPGVTIIPVKVCDATGYCYASAAVDGITYSGDMKFEVINMSFFVDDNEFQQSTEFKCSSDPVQRTFRHAVERAIVYARSQGVTPVAALGNSDQDLAHPVDDSGQPISNECEVVPAETQGVIGTMSLGRLSEKARYSNYGSGMTDIAAPGGNGTTGDCRRTILSTLPGGLYGCIQGTSMASPHAAGVAALIVSQFGKVVAEKNLDYDNDPTTPPRRDLDVVLPPQTVEAYLQASAVDIGLPGYDECFGPGRAHALRAVLHDTSKLYDARAPSCPEYAE
ncbi:MAG: S8 family serine peptidase [Actinobacteria bacterium]|nr:S8 family serine peptidase [Actinomycetota bacterium]